MPAALPVIDDESDVLLRNGTTVRLRPVRDDDAPQVLALFQQLSERSLYYRFMTVPHLDLAQVQRLLAAGDRAQVLVAERGRAVCAVAGYYPGQTGADRAEVAFAIADSMQGCGLGTRMLERLAEIARGRGVRAFDAFVLGENLAMMDVFLQSGFALTQRLERGVFHVVLQLDPTDAYTAASGRRAQLAAAASIRAFFAPRSIAVIGASRQPGHIGSEILRNLRDSGFAGTLTPVHPHAEIVGGLQAYPTVRAIPGPVDLAVIVVPAANCSDVVDDCLAKGVKGVVVISAGFAEVGKEGQTLEAALIDKIRAAGVRLIGPNCMGIINTDPAVRLNATFSPVYPPAGRIAFSTQSGALGLAILDYVTRLNIGISSFASIGNKADVSSNDLLQYWAEDARTDVILLYLESFGNPRKFAEIARRVGRVKPIVAVKAGHSDAGARAAQSHTGARATRDVLVDTMLRDAGVIRTRTLEELFDVATVLANQAVPGGRRVAIVTNAGGPAILAADACEANGLDVPVLSETTQNVLRQLLPPAASVANPVDMIASATPEQYRRVLEIVAADPSVDSIIAIFIPPLVTAAAEVSAAIRAAASATAKPVLASFLGTNGLQPQLAPVPSFAFPESAAIALAHVTRYGEWLRKPVVTAECLDNDVAANVRSIVDAALSEGTEWLSAEHCASLLATAGIPMVRSRQVTTADQAVCAANELGLPVVLKAVGPAILHKSDVGGVRLGLGSEQSVREAFTALTARLGARATAIQVQPMIGDAVEMVVGGLNDASFGPVVMCGMGGVLVDVFDDTAFALCPLSQAAARALIDRIRGRVRLRGFRGARPADEAAFCQMLVAVSQLLHACPEIQELDLNPVMALPTGAIAADVRIRVHRRCPPPAGRRIHY